MDLVGTDVLERIGTASYRNKVYTSYATARLWVWRKLSKDYDGNPTWRGHYFDRTTFGVCSKCCAMSQIHAHDAEETLMTSTGRARQEFLRAAEESCLANRRLQISISITGGKPRKQPRQNAQKGGVI